MRLIDKIAAFLLVALGLVHSSVVGVYVHGQHKDPADGAWFLGAGVAMIAVGLLNFVRVSRPGDSLIRVSSLIANIFAAIFCLAALHAFGAHLKEAPQAIVVAAVVVIELAFSAVPRK
jgi:hypothetical protein